MRVETLKKGSRRMEGGGGSPKSDQNKSTDAGNKADASPKKDETHADSATNAHREVLLTGGRG